MRTAAVALVPICFFVACTGADPASFTADEGNASSSSGSASDASFSIAETDLDFGDVVEGVATTRELTVTNTGAVATTDLRAALVGADAEAFTVSTDACASIDVGASCSIAVTFTPRKVAAINASVLLTAGAAGSRTVALRGRGTATTALGVDPVERDFGVRLVNEGVSQIFKVTNGSRAAGGKVTRVSVAGTDFTIGTDTCTNANLDPGTECSVSVTFKPTALGARSDVLEVTTDLGRKGTARLSGRGGQPPTLTVAPIDLGRLPLKLAVTRTVQVENSGDFATSAALVVKVADPRIAVTSSECDGRVIDARTKCAVQVSVKAAALGSFSSTMTFQVSGMTASTMVDAKGTVLAAPTLSGGFGAGNAYLPGNVGNGSSRKWFLTFTNYGAFETGLITVAPPMGSWTVATDRCTNATLPAANPTPSSCAVELWFNPAGIEEVTSSQNLLASAASGINGSVVVTDHGTTAVCSSDVECGAGKWCSDAKGCSLDQSAGGACDTDHQCSSSSCDRGQSPPACD